jgi:hypothetical protein
MAMLEGTINTPVGTVPKKAAVLIGGGVALLIGVMYYRGKKMGGDASAAGASTEINPATGYIYGSPEDAAAMAAQAGYITGGMAGGGGSSGGDSPAGTGFINNAQWVQSTIAGMTNSGIITDAAALSVALGKYIAGGPVGDNTTARSLIEQAIAFNGPPPLAGPNGYPPSINTANPVPPVNTPPGDTPSGTNAPEFLPVPLNVDLEGWIAGLNGQYPGLNLTWAKYMSLNDLDGANRKYWHVVNGQPQFFKWHPTLGIPPLRIR